jgi:hypothetical protein
MYDVCNGCNDAAIFTLRNVGVAAVYLHGFARVLDIAQRGFGFREFARRVGPPPLSMMAQASLAPASSDDPRPVPAQAEGSTRQGLEEVPEHDNAEPHRKLVEALTREGVYVPPDQRCPSCGYPSACVVGDYCSDACWINAGCPEVRS